MISEKQAEVAAGWWADVIKNPKMDNGDDSDNGGIGMMLALLNVKDVTDEQVNTFKYHLYNKIKGEDRPILRVDYNPSETLRWAMEKDGIPLSNAPIKTEMVFRDGTVLVSYGYGAPFIDLMEEQTV